MPDGDPNAEWDDVITDLNIHGVNKPISAKFLGQHKVFDSKYASLGTVNAGGSSGEGEGSGSDWADFAKADVGVHYSQASNLCWGYVSLNVVFSYDYSVYVQRTNTATFYAYEAGLQVIVEVACESTQDSAYHCNVTVVQTYQTIAQYSVTGTMVTWQREDTCNVARFTMFVCFNNLPSPAQSHFSQ